MAESITITDNRTGESVEIPIEHGGVSSGPWTKLLPGIWFEDEAYVIVRRDQDVANSANAATD